MAETSAIDLDPATEAEITAFLLSGVLPGPVRLVETHGARVFIGRDETLKIKRPVLLAYMDFSTRDRRQAACRREIEINSRFAPDLYLGLTAITREPDGTLALDGRGAVLELAVCLRTFPADAGLDTIASRAVLDPGLCLLLGDSIAALHATAPPAAAGGGRSLAHVRARLLASAEARRAVLGSGHVDAWAATSEAHLTRAARVLERRRELGCVRRCHGDLHLGNIVLWKGRPVPFDAIEFDEDLATIDPIYDLAFLLMDLVHRRQDVAANLVLNRYLWRLGEQALRDETWAGLAALPVAMSLRALVRAVVAVDRGGADPEARQYMATALLATRPAPPRLIAVGGFSGTGKSTVAAALAPALGALPGAIHLRSDLERKRMMGCEPTQRLGPTGYTPEVTAAVYALLKRKAEVALNAGHSVIVDAVSARTDERRDLAALAEKCGVPFDGLWLTADPAVLAARVAGRRNDASDATTDVLARQLEQGAGPVDWHVIDAGGEPAATLAIARATLA